jgi:bacteriorhodopsin
LSDQLAQINAEFRAQQFHYFDSTSALNWVCCASALVLVGGLLSLIMFDTGSVRAFYLAVLVLSFVFMIGPSFHSIMSAIVGFLHAPSVY